MKEKKIIVLVSILSIFSYCLSILFPKITQWFVDNYLTQLIPEGSDFELVLLGIGISILLTIVIYFLRFFTIVIMKINTEKVLLKKVFSHLVNLPYSFFETRTYGDLITRLGSVNYVKDFILDNVISSIFDFGVGVILIIYIGTISYKILLAALVLILINSITLVFTRRPIEFANKEEIINASQVNSIQVETIYSIFTTKILRLEDIVLKNWSREFKSYLEKRREREYYQIFITGVQSILNTIAPLIMVLAGYFAYKNGMVSLGDIIISQSFILNLLSISSKVINTFNIYLIASNYLDRVVDITNKEVEKISGDILDDINTIEFKDVDFSYNKDGQKVLKNISLNISKGEKIAFVGSTGSGKSTLAKLLMGLYKPVKGQVLINGKDMASLDKDNLLKLATIVPQDIYIYAKNIEENIKLERENVTMQDIEEAAKTACIHDDIMQFPLKYNTMLSDMGMNLSGGQRQRVVIARSLINKPKMIVFDEGTSFLDNVTEKNIMRNLKEKDSTIIMIAHRLDTIIDSDKIYFLKNGEIVESGTHEELMKNQGEYYKLYTARGENIISLTK
ncbi:ABC-type bacteriocin/lantibiotic exporter, contains an N-terminal double-glycine peptidase domain [Clostridium sp. DSM 8431]|uniref:peptidase domain-containing ABC transporter n=1 Tax=Clostridium sp. DSM 8431 TaxID=1761781 RepID=UPI0008F3BFFD|nr:peptidase domain-containing ABC transporter [Clostridium sp. DSM 8431]SFU68866.1 ABC-type bacteriocin/lantibiotic exporter, contains an N-terminal double-glycine peptidase domain [Clostridium sp. DSM 8431]